MVLAVLFIVNLWVFTGENGLGKLDQRATSIAIEPSAMGLAIAPESACSGDPVRIFAGLEAQIEHVTTLREGKTLRLALLDLGVLGVDIELAETNLGRSIDLGLLAGSGAPLRVRTDRERALQAVEIELADGHLVQACRHLDGLEVRNIQHPLRVELAAVALTIPHGGGLLDAVREAEELPELARRVAAVLAWDMDFMVDVRAQDRVSIVVEKRYLGRHFHRYGRIMAVRVRGAAGRLEYYDGNTRGRAGQMFDWQGRPMQRARLHSPLAWYPGNFEARSTLEPYVEFVSGRVGAQYRRPVGAPVVALASGVVESAGPDGDDGIVLEIRALDGGRIRYAHLLRLLRDFAPGDRVEQGETVALVGQSGRTPRSRLRLEVYDADGTAVDPLSPVTEPSNEDRHSAGVRLDARELRAFHTRVERWRGLLDEATG